MTSHSNHHFSDLSAWHPPYQPTQLRTSLLLLCIWWSGQNISAKYLREPIKIGNYRWDAQRYTHPRKLNYHSNQHSVPAVLKLHCVFFCQAINLTYQSLVVFCKIEALNKSKVKWRTFHGFGKRLTYVREKSVLFSLAISRNFFAGELSTESWSFLGPALKP